MLGTSGTEIETLEVRVLSRQFAIPRAYSVEKRDHNQSQKDRNHP